MSGRITLSTTDKAEAVYDKLEKDIENLYGGKSAFWRSCLMNFDDKSRIKAKIELIEQRIEEKQNEIQDLKLQKKGLETELEEVEEQTEEQEGIGNTEEVDEEYWDTTVKKIFKRTSPNQPDSVEERWNRWFDGRHKLFVNKYYELPARDLKEKILDKAEEKGFDEEVEKLR